QARGLCRLVGGETAGQTEQEPLTRQRQGAAPVKGMRIVSQAMRITDWPPSERPRERLLEKGADTLSDAELVAVLLRSGVRGKSAVDMARELLTQYGGVTHMLEAGAELEAMTGVGPAKRAQFAAAIEL